MSNSVTSPPLPKQVLHVGCGSATIERMTSGFRQGWKEIRFDINPSVNPDLVGTITDMAAVTDESVDAVYSSHNVEHVYSYQVASVLKEFRRVLKSDGFLVVTCPDIQSVAKQVAEGRLTDPLYISPAGPITALDIIYGHAASLTKGEEYMAHRTAFTAETLTTELRGAGFGTIGMRRRERAWDLWAIATKRTVDQAMMRQLMADYLPPKA